MCGIAGFVGQGDREVLESMGRALIHRGPDGEGRYVDESRRLFLLHRRLAILDIQGGEQPMWNEDGQVCVLFNGEIYNHAELRERLVAQGHVFRSDHSDTEVLVHGYEEWGEELPKHLNGMFAFALYDKRRAVLFLARDRFGKKPLYYAAQKGLFAFASELKALLQHRSIDRTLSRPALQKYFAYGFIPAPHSLYSSVAKLPGGYCMTYDLATEKLKVKRYWLFEIEPHEHLPKNPEEEWGEELRSLLSSAVKRRLMSDVPLGIFLSGGIDSSAILAFTREQLPAGQIKTFAIGFQEATFDESAYARRAANLFASDHYEEILSLEKARELAGNVLRRLDEPFADASILPTYLLCAFARRHVTVALCGDGADELFAGYDPFKALSAARWYRCLTTPGLRRGVQSLARLLPVSEKNMSLDFKIRRGLRGAAYPAPMWNPVWLGPLDPCEIEDLFSEPVSAEDIYGEAIQAWENTSATSLVDKTLEFYTRFYLQDDILTKVDRASMMVSMEVRAPFLDNEVVDFARKIPHRYKYRRGQTKYLLKTALGSKLPNDILFRKKKGFGIPLMSWMKEWSTVPAVNPGSLPISASKVEKKWQEHKAGKEDHRLFLWAWLALEQHLDSL